MKSTSFLIMFTLFSISVFAGGIPGEVKQAFEQKFPGAVSVRWDKENSHEYEASFTWKDAKYSANFSDHGKWLETESAIPFPQLPKEVSDAFRAAHKAAKVKGSSRIETSEGLTRYEIEIKRGMKTIEVFYDAQGKELKQ
jgi:hypothetical protein